MSGRRARWHPARSAILAAAACIACAVGAPALAASTIDVGVCVDGQDSLIIRGQTLQWIYGNYDRVGDRRDDCSTAATIVSTTGHGAADITAAQWTPSFPGGTYSTIFTAPGPLLPTGPISSIGLAVLQGRGSLTIQQAPLPANGETLILNFDDDAASGAAYYEALITIASVPEPTTWALALLGLFLVGASIRWRPATAFRPA